MKIVVYTQSGEENGTVELPKEIFEVPFNKDLIHQALVMQLSNGRVNLAHTKIRGEVRGGGKKPYAQKHTGRARQGTTRAPHMRGGSVIFGPRNVRNFVLGMPKLQRRKALFSALSEKARSNEIIALESYNVDKPKTKDFASFLKKLPIERNVLIVLPAKNENLEKSSKNLPSTKTILANYLNIQDLQKYKKILFLKEAIGKLNEIFLK